MTKEHILQEIKRIALANGGKPPGMHAFDNAAGIKKHEWQGKFWLRWSEALQEAGFAPNQMQEGYEEDFLLEKLIGLAREIGHFPIDSELRMKAFKDKGFPSTETFRNNLGRKNLLVSKVAMYCQHTAGFEDVLRMCEASSPKIKDGLKSEEDSEAKGKIGIVYLIKSGKYYKIGKTNSIGRREYDIALQLAEKPTTVHIINTDDPDGVEAYWHRRFASKRKNGEWFDLNAADVKAFKKWLRIV